MVIVSKNKRKRRRKEELLNRLLDPTAKIEDKEEDKFSKCPHCEEEYTNDLYNFHLSLCDKNEALNIKKPIEEKKIEEKPAIVRVE